MVEITDKHIELAQACVRKFLRGRPPADADAYEGAALEALVKAAREFDGRGTFNRYAAQKMWYAMLDQNRHLSVMSRHHIKSIERGEEVYVYRIGNGKTEERARTTIVSLHAPLFDEGLSALDIYGSEDGDSDAKMDVASFIDTLRPRDRFIVLARMNGMSQKEIGDLLGVTEGRISQLSRAVGKRYKIQLRAAA